MSKSVRIDIGLQPLQNPLAEIQERIRANQREIEQNPVLAKAIDSAIERDHAFLDEAERAMKRKPRRSAAVVNFVKDEDI